MKWFSISIVILILSYLSYQLIQSPEKYLKKKTQKLIALSSIKLPKSDLNLISQVSKIAKYIHFDIQLEAEYEGKIYKARSLNEFRSLLFVYLKQKSTETLTYKNLIVNIKKDKNKALVSFDAFFERNQATVFCKTLLEWVKEKRWYIKKIEIFSCSTKAL